MQGEGTYWFVCTANTKPYTQLHKQYDVEIIGAAGNPVSGTVEAHRVDTALVAGQLGDHVEPRDEVQRPAQPRLQAGSQLAAKLGEVKGPEERMSRS